MPSLRTCLRILTALFALYAANDFLLDTSAWFSDSVYRAAPARSQVAIRAAASHADEDRHWSLADGADLAVDLTVGRPFRVVFAILAPVSDRTEPPTVAVEAARARAPPLRLV